MLKLILGRARSGKTHKCIEIARQSVLDNESVIMLVPEQYSFECQKHLLEALGPKLSNKIEIHSFTSLCEAICAEIGGVSGYNVDDGIRYILVGQAIRNVRDNLQLFSKYTNSKSFIKQMMSTITELKQASVTAENLLEFSKNIDSELFKMKVKDIALIFSSYDALLKDKFIDPLELIENTVQRMHDNSFFNNKTVIIDEFKGFTAPQFKLLERIIIGSKFTYATFCCDSLVPKNDTDIFKNIKLSAERLLKIAKANNITVSDSIFLENNKNLPNDLNAFENFCAGELVDDFIDSTENVTLCSAQTIYQEVDFCFNTIRRMVREEGYRYRDFVIISRDESPYSSLIEQSANQYHVPCFTDLKVSVISLPFTNFVLSALNAAVSFDSEDIIKCVKTELFGLNSNEISCLENYVYVWSITGKKWLNDWTMNSEGLKSGEYANSEHALNEIKAINDLRIRVIKPLENLRYSLKGNAQELSTALLRFIENCGAVDALRKYTDELSHNSCLLEADYQRLGYDAFMRVLDNVVLSCGDGEISPTEFIDVLSSALEYETIGNIPKTLDQVMFGTADRIRTRAPKVVFVLGANQDVFPAAVSDTGLFSQKERSLLIENDMNVSDCGMLDCLDEKFLFYSSCTMGFEKLFLLYSTQTLSGGAMEPSIEIINLKQRFTNINHVKIDSQIELSGVETAESAFGKLAENFNKNCEVVNELKSYFKNNSDYCGKLFAIENYILNETPKINETTAQKLYGDTINLSASKADDFAGCKFMYFCKYGIGAKELNKVDFDPLTRGNIVHYCLEKFVMQHLDDIGELSVAAIKAEIEQLCDQYLNENCNDTSALDEKFNYMMTIVKDTCCSLAEALNNEFHQSEFRPRYCELKVGLGGEVDGINVLTDNGKNVFLNGYIDRVDTTKDGKVRVVDYKTGSKGDSFKLSELLNGQNMQMLLYLYTLLKNGSELIKAEIPAGVLYFPAKRQAFESETKFVKMNGIVLDDIETLNQMEADINGKIIPARKRQGSDSFYSKESLVSNEAFSLIFKYIELLLKKIGNSLLSGDISPMPLKMGDKLKCQYCDYRAVCRFDPYRVHKDSIECKNSDALSQMENELEEVANGD